jgi:predicted dehydrogenase
VTSTPDSAAAATARWGVPATPELGSALDDPGVDVVVVAVRVPRHAEIVDAAIGAGKHVYCEWPLAVDTAEANRLAARSAGQAGRVHVAGLQGRFAPAVHTASRLLAEGGIGRPLTANLRLYLRHGLVARPAHRAHLRHRAVSANVLSIQAGHTLDMLGALLVPVLGRPRVHSARLWSAVPEFVVETGERLPRDAPDNLVTVLEYGGTTVVAHFTQTSPRESFALEIHGTAGMLALRSAGQPQFGGLELTVMPLDRRSAETVPDDDPDLTYRSPLPGDHPGHNLASAYAALAEFVHTGRSAVPLPDFRAAVELHELLDAVRARAT